ncbi:glycoprotein precursor [Wuhan horsefly Virus]|uniref:Glycoprotein n=1 Tax=Wuhan horsefly Virus TaxID=1608139 RepID=A0A0B5KY39_9VIRU|nr:glycoprotein precursor [Wuhan horsefly Virus]AJG39293.1 glycoprotein precursor [Wuhan horsefly Virus]
MGCLRFIIIVISILIVNKRVCSMEDREIIVHLTNKVVEDATIQDKTEFLIYLNDITSLDPWYHQIGCKTNNCGLRYNNNSKQYDIALSQKNVNLGWFYGSKALKDKPTYPGVDCLTPFIVINDKITYVPELLVKFIVSICSSDRGRKCKACDNNCVYQSDLINFGLMRTNCQLVIVENNTTIPYDVIDSPYTYEDKCVNGEICMDSTIESLCYSGSCTEIKDNQPEKCVRIPWKYPKYGIIEVKLQNNKTSQMTCKIDDFCTLIRSYTYFTPLLHPYCSSTKEKVIFYTLFIMLIWSVLILTIQFKLYKVLYPCYKLTSCLKFEIMKYLYERHSIEIEMDVLNSDGSARKGKKSKSWLKQLLLLIFCLQRVESSCDFAFPIHSSTSVCINGSCDEMEFMSYHVPSGNLHICGNNIDIYIMKTYLRCVPDILYYTPITIIKASRTWNCLWAGDCTNTCNSSVINHEINEKDQYVHLRSCEKVPGSGNVCRYDDICVWRNIFIAGKDNGLKFLRVSSCTEHLYFSSLLIKSENQSFNLMAEHGTLYNLGDKLSFQIINTNSFRKDLKLLELGDKGYLGDANNLHESVRHKPGSIQCEDSDIYSNCRWNKESEMFDGGFQEHYLVDNEDKPQRLDEAFKKARHIVTADGVEIENLPFTLMVSNRNHLKDKISLDLGELTIANGFVEGLSYLDNKCKMSFTYSLTEQMVIQISSPIITSSILKLDKAKESELSINCTCLYSEVDTTQITFSAYHLSKTYTFKTNLSHPIGHFTQYHDIFLGKSLGGYDYFSGLSHFFSSHSDFIYSIVGVIIVLFLLKLFLC